MFSRLLLASLVGTATAADPANGVYNVVVERYTTSDCSGAPEKYDFQEIGQCTPADGKYKKAVWDAANLSWTETKYNDSACTTADSSTPKTEFMNCTLDGSKYYKGMRSDDANSGTLYIEIYPNSSCSGTPEEAFWHGGDKCINYGDGTSMMHAIYGKGGGLDTNHYSAANCTAASLNTTKSYSVVGGFVCTAYPANSEQFGKYYKLSTWHPNGPAGTGVASGSVVMSPAVPLMGLLGFAVSLRL